MKVLIPQDIREAGKNYLKERGYDVVLGSGIDTETVKREIADADAVIMRAVPTYSADVIAAGKKLKIMARYGVGLDNVDVAAAEKQGVYVTSAKDCNLYSVAEHAVMMMLTLARSQVFLDRESRKGGWNLRHSHSIFEVRGKTLGIVGLGAIGRQTARMAHDGLEMKIIGFDPYADAAKLPQYVTLVSFEEMLKTADVISLHIPYTPETHHMFNAATLKMMKPSAYLVNCGRGGIISEDDLYEALKGNVIAGAALDVFKQEPVDLSNKLLTLDNFIVSPHNAGLTVEAADAMALSCAQAVDDVLNGRKPVYPVNNPKKA